MRKRLRIVAVGLVVAAIGGLACWAFSGPREPVYQGKRLTEWLKEASDYDGGPDSFEQIDIAIRAMGTNAVPWLINMLQRKDSPFKIEALKLAEKQRFVKIRHVPAPQAILEAETGCRILGAVATPAIPQLERLFFIEEGRGAAGHALARVGPEGVRFLIGQLANTNRDLSAEALFSLASLKDGSDESEIESDLSVEDDIAVPLLFNILSNRNDPMCVPAIELLGFFRRRADIVVPTLISALEQARKSKGRYNDRVRDLAIQALGRFGDEASNAVPVLLSIRTNSLPGTRSVAEAALKAIDPEGAAKAGVK